MLEFSLSTLMCQLFHHFEDFKTEYLVSTERNDEVGVSNISSEIPTQNASVYPTAQVNTYRELL